MFDCFLKLEGVKGESLDKTHKDLIDVSSFSWGGTQPGTMHGGGGGGAGKASFQDLAISKRLDAASATLWQYVALGKHFPTAKLIARKSGGSPVDYFVLDMEEVLVSSISVGGSSQGSDAVDEQITLNFAKFKITYQPQKADGSADAAIDFGFSIKQNAKA